MDTLSSLPGFAPLYVVGLGPGSADLLTPEALSCLEYSKVICGYTGYVEQLSPSLLKEKEIISTGMMGEVARARAAVEKARAGYPVSVVCSGDPGIYALAGLVLEIIESEGFSPSDFPLHMVPGVPAVCAAAALLGAPLMHDFAVISLSDLLTPWQTILHRLDCAFSGDFVTALYNPRSKKRTNHLKEALAIGLRHRKAETPVGVVRNAYRPDQTVAITFLSQVNLSCVDMFSILLIGNSCSRIVPGEKTSPLMWENGARILTPRGYAKKYKDLA